MALFLGYGCRCSKAERRVSNDEVGGEVSTLDVGDTAPGITALALAIAACLTCPDPCDRRAAVTADSMDAGACSGTDAADQRRKGYPQASSADFSASACGNCTLFLALLSDSAVT